MGLEINVISNEETFILDLIDQINDPLEKRKAIEHYLNMANHKPTKIVQNTVQEHELYSYNKILEKAKQKEREPTISELKGEIDQIKSEIKYLKERVNTLLKAIL